MVRSLSPVSSPISHFIFVVNASDLMTRNYGDYFTSASKAARGIIKSDDFCLYKINVTASDDICLIYILYTKGSG